MQYRHVQVTPVSSVVGDSHTNPLSMDPKSNPIKEAKNPLKIITDIIIDSLCDSTMHGIPNVFKRQNSIIRVFWLICFLLSAGVCCWMISETILAYFEFETVTKTQRVHLVVTEFPAVSICNINPYMTNSGYEFVKNVLVSNKFVSPLAPTAFFRFLFEDALRRFRFVVGMTALIPSQTNATRKSFGRSLEEMLLSCTYNMNSCTANDFEWYYDAYYGNCYKFNTGNQDIILL